MVSCGTRARSDENALKIYGCRFTPQGPNLRVPSNSPTFPYYDSICTECPGDGVEEQCAVDENPFAGPLGAMECLVNGPGEVAFVGHTSVNDYVRATGEFSSSVDSQTLVGV